MTARNDRPLRVVHVFNTLNGGGLQRVVLALSRWMREEHDVEALLVSHGGPLERQLEPTDRWVGKAQAGGFFGEVMQLLSIVRREKPDVLHAHQRRDALSCLIVGAVTRTPVVEHAHNTLPNTGIKALSFRAPMTFAVSNQVRDMIVHTYRRDPATIHVVGGVPFNLSSEPPYPRPDEAGRPRRILGIGRLEEQKDPERFIRAIASAARRVPVEARWLGDGGLRGQCERLALELDAPVTFVGPSDRVTEELDAADGLLMTSRWEGLGLVILEAFARERPVVGLAHGGMGELLAEGRGTLLPSDVSDEALAEAVIGGTATSVEVGHSIDLASDYVSRHATAEVVYGAVLAGYRSIIDRTRGASCHLSQ
ncbi:MULTISPECIES: glycosyltransferase [unclassified Microbacterium]|uniref:glycosyltransferase n=1 Tax=unclassified Microbacterium TaxID=2609290 RepID=UPI00177E9658|nr:MULTISPECIES: glycosyltransferase [unclassified Microbacterium]MBD8207667.1 glycosyltransferase [Microbacterium sp. CFBP 8801]MBD8478155.1 glycosyltransferase [Microbacterium sp. CFBP 8794]MBD8508584.1 glycosyltransferase [Microbacterium sp. CFBP 8790]